MPNLSINLKIINPIIKDSITILKDVKILFENDPLTKLKDFLETLDDYIKDLLVKMNLSRFLVGSDYLQVSICSIDSTYKLLKVSRYNYKTPSEIIKVSS